MAADDVDRIVSAWRRERPDLDVSPLEVLSRVSRLARRLDRARGTAFMEPYAAHLAEAYPRTPVGVLFPFRRVFAVGQKTTA